ncbi:MAG: hypothetical protein EA378_10750 [Phycisphaerales bacterium]|nr:MAG: hypothetical protein EA378_10750 [Phycisphaerales bacterium]
MMNPGANGASLRKGLDPMSNKAGVRADGARGLPMRVWLALGVGGVVTAGAVVVVAQPLLNPDREADRSDASALAGSAGSGSGGSGVDSGVGVGEGWASSRAGAWAPGPGWSDESSSGVDLSEHMAAQRAGRPERPNRPEGGFWSQVGEGERFNWREMSEEDRQAFRERMQAMREERRAAFAARFDLDGDGVLNDEERAAMEAHIEAQRERGRALRQQFVERFDLDGDGQLSRAEAELARETIMGEVRAARNLERLAEGGEMLSPDQLAMGLTLVSEGDPAADFNGDGVVDQADAQRLIDAFNAGELPIDPMLRQAQRIMMAETGRGRGGPGGGEWRQRVVTEDGSVVVIEGERRRRGPRDGGEGGGAGGDGDAPAGDRQGGG